MSDPDEQAIADEPRERRREALAKLLAADMMKMRRDPTGFNLPPDLWRLMLPKADAILLLVRREVIGA